MGKKNNNKVNTSELYIVSMLRISEYANGTNGYELKDKKDFGFYLNFEKAVEDIQRNCLTTEDAGKYNYMCIISYELDSFYAAEEPYNLHLYRRNEKTNLFEEIEDNGKHFEQNQWLLVKFKLGVRYADDIF